MRTGRSRGSSKQFESKRADKLIKRKNFQPSPDSVIADEPGRFGVEMMVRVWNACRRAITQDPITYKKQQINRV